MLACRGWLARRMSSRRIGGDSRHWNITHAHYNATAMACKASWPSLALTARTCLQRAIQAGQEGVVHGRQDCLLCAHAAHLQEGGPAAWVPQRAVQRLIGCAACWHRWPTSTRTLLRPGTPHNCYIHSTASQPATAQPALTAAALLVALQHLPLKPATRFSHLLLSTPNKVHPVQSHPRPPCCAPASPASQAT